MTAPWPPHQFKKKKCIYSYCFSALCSTVRKGSNTSQYFHSQTSQNSSLLQLTINQCLVAEYMKTNIKKQEEIFSYSVEGRIIPSLLPVISEHCQVFKITYLEKTKQIPKSFVSSPTSTNGKKHYLRSSETLLWFLLLLIQISKDTVRQQLAMYSIVMLLTGLSLGFACN